MWAFINHQFVEAENAVLPVSDVLYIKNGYISELPRSNVFVVTPDNKLLTANENILYGITRKHILQIAKRVMEVAEQPVSLNDVLNAKEVFVSSTTKRLLPVFGVNGTAIGKSNRCPVTSSLYHQFLTLEKGFI
jgi:branched-chain amino acid aminotransferase